MIYGLNSVCPIDPVGSVCITVAAVGSSFSIGIGLSPFRCQQCHCWRRQKGFCSSHGILKANRRVCQWSEFPSSKSVWQIIDNFSIPYSPARCVRVRDTKKRWKIASRADFGQIWNGHTQKKWELFSVCQLWILSSNSRCANQRWRREFWMEGLQKKYLSLLLEWWITFPNGWRREPLRAF